MSRQQTPPFGALLKTLRTAAGLTQEALAERAGLSVRGLQDLERGQIQRPHRDTVELLAAALALTGWDRTTFYAAAGVRPAGNGAPSPFQPLLSSGALVPLVGRGDELALLDRFLTGEQGPLGAAPALVLAGEPGIGKSRLLQAAAQRAIVMGWRVLAGGCQRRGGQEPYAPLIDALAQHLQAAGQDDRRVALAGCGWLVRLLPELAGVLEPLAAALPAPEQERRLIAGAVARLLVNVAGPAGTLLVLDDLQWAGADALDLLATLLRASTAPLRILGAYRDTEVRPSDPLSLLLADLAQARLVRRHPLGPLAEAEAANLLDNLLVDLAPGDHGQVETVLRRAGGTPFFLISYAQALHQGDAAGIPWDVAQGVRQRVALLPEAGQEVLAAAAVVGRHARRVLLPAVMGQPEEAVLTGLEAACRARLLLEEGEDAYVFAHDMIREVVEADLSTARRALLHRKVAEALETGQTGATLETLAYHYDRGGNPDKAARYLELAGDHAWTQRAHAAAEGHYRTALERLEAMGQVQEALRLREKLGNALTRVARYEAAVRVLERATDAYRAAGDWEGLGRVAAGIAEAALGSSYGVAMARLQPLMAQLERAGTATPTSGLYLWWGVILIGASRYDEALSALERATELARADADGRTLVLAGTHRADILQRLGQFAQAVRIYEDTLTLAAAMGNFEALVSAHRDVALIYALQGAFADGMRQIDQSLAAATQLEEHPNRAFTLAVRGWLTFLAGDSRAGHEDLDRALALTERFERSWHRSYTLIFQARLLVAEGDWAGAAAALQEAISLAEGTGDQQVQRWAVATMAEVEILGGRPEAAAARLIPIVDRLGTQECDLTTLLPVLAWAQLALGELDLADRAVEQAIARARPEGMRLVLVEALRVWALITIRLGRWDEAARYLEEGLALARTMPYPYAEARLLHVAGALHAARGAVESARERWQEALARFTDLGARADMALTAQALQALPGAQAPEAQPSRTARIAPDAEPRIPADRRLARAERQSWALNHLRVDGALSPRAYAAALGVSVDTALRDLSDLAQRGAVIAQGTTKDREYVLPP